MYACRYRGDSDVKIQIGFTSPGDDVKDLTIGLARATQTSNVAAAIQGCGG